MAPDAAVAERIAAAVDRLGRAAAIGLSGFGGAGKSTLAETLAAAVPGIEVVSADDFLDPAGCRVVSDDWAGLERPRLVEQLLDPFRRSSLARWQRRDWTAGLAEWRTLPACDVLVVEGVGVLHPSLHWDLTVWLDVPLDVAVARGIARDRALGRGVDGWGVWAGTDAAFFERFRPDLSADLVLPG